MLRALDDDGGGAHGTNDCSVFGQSLVLDYCAGMYWIALESTNDELVLGPAGSDYLANTPTGIEINKRHQECRGTGRVDTYY